MTHRPRFSIVTATLNRKALLQRTIDSIRLQTYGDFEHIVMDGGSTDGTVEMLRDLEKDYPMRWRSEPD